MPDTPEPEIDHRAEARHLLQRARDHYYQGRNAANLIAAAHVHVLMANGALGEQLLGGAPGLEPVQMVVRDEPGDAEAAGFIPEQRGSSTPAGVTHLSPAPGFGITPCCGRRPFELPGADRMTVDSAAVDCRGQETR